MTARSCVICGCYSTRPFCPSCMDNANLHLDRICAHLKEYPRSTVMEVCNETSVPLPVVYGLKDAGFVELIPSDGEVYLTTRSGKFLSKLRDCLEAIE